MEASVFLIHNSVEGGVFLGIKKNLVAGIITGLIGLALISGGTAAFFSDALDTKNKILSGYMDLDIGNLKNERVLFEFDNKKPGDTFNHSFNMKNNGTLDMKEVTLYSKHTTYNREGTQENNGFANQIVLQRLEVDGKNILQKPMSLEKLSKTPIVLEKNIAANSPATQVFVEFEFEKTKENQNEFQGNQLELLWTFEAIQADD